MKRLVFVMLAGCVVVRAGNDPSNEPKATPNQATEEAPSKHVASAPRVSVDDLKERVASAREKLSSDPVEAAKELAAARAELLARWSKLESTQPQPSDERRMRPSNPFFSDTLSEEGKELLATTHSLRAGLWTDQGKIDEALRELVTTMGRPSAIPCGDGDTSCQRARAAVSQRYKGFCWTFASSKCSPGLDDDNFAFADKSRTTLFAQAWVRKVVPRGQGVDILTGDVQSTDLEICKGEFQTDKILDVDERRILIERTTWCREIAKQRRAGWRITHHLGRAPVALEAGDHVLLVADAAKVRRRKVGDTVVVDADSVLVSVHRDRPIYRWNEIIP